MAERSDWVPGIGLTNSASGRSQENAQARKHGKLERADHTGEARGKWIANRLNGYRELGHDLVSWAAGQSPGEAAEPKKGRRKGNVASGFWRCLI